MEKNEVLEEEKEEKKVDENKIKVITDFSPVITNIEFLARPYKDFKIYYARISVLNSADILVKVDNSLIDYVKTCQKFEKESFKSKIVVKEETENQKDYVCVKYVSLKGNVYRYFLSRADVERLEMVFEEYQKNNKK